KGWTVFTASDGRSGLNKTGELLPDAVVLDLAMPKVDGWTVLKHLRASSMTAQIPVVVVSALPDARDEAFQAGCDAYLAKPCPPDTLHRQLFALLKPRVAGMPAFLAPLRGSRRRSRPFRRSLCLRSTPVGLPRFTARRSDERRSCLARRSRAACTGTAAAAAARSRWRRAVRRDGSSTSRSPSYTAFARGSAPFAM